MVKIVEDVLGALKFVRFFKLVPSAIDVKIQPVHGLAQAIGVLLQTLGYGLSRLRKKAMRRMPLGMNFLGPVVIIVFTHILTAMLIKRQIIVLPQSCLMSL